MTDLHCPFEDKRSLQAVEQYMADHSWDYYINLGDHLDYFSISRFNEEKPGLIEGRTIIEECKEGEKVLARHVQIIKKKNPKAELYLLEGNHEYRATDFALRSPQLRGIIEPEQVLKLEEKGIKYVKSWRNKNNVIRIGKAMFVHGSAVNQHHAKKMVESYEDNIFYGHLHDVNSFNKTSIGTGKTKVGQSLGCLCRYPEELDYTKGAPTNWQQAVTTFFFFPDGNFNHYISRIVEHRVVSPDGKIYQG